MLEVEGTTNNVVVMAIMEGLRPGPLFDSLSKNTPKTQLALQRKANKYIAVEKLVEAKWRGQGRDDHKRKEPNTRSDYKDEVKNRRSDRDSRRRSNDRCPRTPPPRPEMVLPPLTLPSPKCLWR